MAESVKAAVAAVWQVAVAALIPGKGFPITVKCPCGQSHTFHLRTTSATRSDGDCAKVRAWTASHIHLWDRSHKEHMAALKAWAESHGIDPQTAKTQDYKQRKAMNRAGNMTAGVAVE